MKLYLIALNSVFALIASAANADEPPPIKLMLTPAKSPTPALRYQLLPDARLIISGDAAPLYRQVSELLEKKQFGKKAALFDSWASQPVEQLPKEAVRKALAEYAEVFDPLDKAARCGRCDWGVLQRLRDKGIQALFEEAFATLVPELESMRSCGKLLALRARLAMADGRFDNALVALRTGLALARFTGETESLGGFRVGVAIAADMQQQVDTFVGAPNAPNLYYALTDLPAPLVSPRKAIEGHRLEVYGAFPGVAEIALNLDAGNLSEEQLVAMMKALDFWKRFEGFSDRRLYYPERLLLARNIQQKHAVATQALIEAGRPRDKVQAMPHVQVALLHALLEYDVRLDQLLTSQQRPYWEFAERLKRLSQPNRLETPRTSLPTETTERLWREKDPNAPAIPLVSLLLPRMDKVVFARVRTDRKIALLRTIEALRFYAATHDGQLPPSLAAVQEVPVPLDPVTGTAFEYEHTGGTATLRAPAPGNEIPYRGNTVVYELRLRK